MRLAVSRRSPGRIFEQVLILVVGGRRLTTSPHIVGITQELNSMGVLYGSEGFMLEGLRPFPRRGHVVWLLWKGKCEGRVERPKKGSAKRDL